MLSRFRQSQYGIMHPCAQCLLWWCDIPPHLGHKRHARPRGALRALAATHVAATPQHHVHDAPMRPRGHCGGITAPRVPAAAEAGWVIDTPGVRSFGLAHVDLARIIQHFPDLEPGTEQCPRGCTHDEEECALDAWVESGRAGAAGQSRLDSLRRLLRARSAPSED